MKRGIDTHTNRGETRVFRKILSALGMGEAQAPRPTPRHPASGPQPIKPYRDDSCNFIYNLLFCDDLKLFETPDPSPPMTTLLAERPDAAALREIANDAATYDSRIRVVAFNRLREMGEPVPSKLLLGVILEVPVNGGLDTLGAFADGDVRYINHTEKMSIFVGGGHPLVPHVQRLMEASRPVVDQIGPWTEARLPPPPADSVRMTFLVSDGLYFGQGPFQALSSDPMGGPVIAAGTALLVAVTDHQQPA